jgi:hypothetical protein
LASIGSNVRWWHAGSDAAGGNMASSGTLCARLSTVSAHASCAANDEANRSRAASVVTISPGVNPTLTLLYQVTMVGAVRSRTGGDTCDIC